ncbi:hypothetical protein RJT34_12578 [Clitoria ternatea]|uniref:Uncharacterized protein n=1 Tax=Clitoria ternatea TaxID=43366 RepID=A0AAN9JP17_CLITE
MSTPYTSFSPQQQQDGIQISDDKHFALHGEILLFVFVTLFFLIFVFFLMMPCLKNHTRGSRESETDEDSIGGQNYNNTTIPSHNRSAQEANEMSRRAKSPVL